MTLVNKLQKRLEEFKIISIVVIFNFPYLHMIKIVSKNYIIQLKRMAANKDFYALDHNNNEIK